MDEQKNKAFLYSAIGILIGVIIAGIIFLVVSKKSDDTKPQVIDNSIAASEQTTNASDIETKSAEPTEAQVLPMPEEESQAPRKLKVVNANYNYSLSPEYGNTYRANNMFDGNPSTCWAVNLNEAPIDCDMLWGPTITLDKPSTISHIVVRNGYCKNSDIYHKNARPMQLQIYNGNYDTEEFPEAVIVDGNMKDTMQPQQVKAKNSKYNKNVKQLGLQIPCGSWFSGNKYDDLCISEIEIWGW